MTFEGLEFCNGKVSFLYVISCWRHRLLKLFLDFSTLFEYVWHYNWRFGTSVTTLLSWVPPGLPVLVVSGSIQLVLKENSPKFGRFCFTIFITYYSSFQSATWVNECFLRFCSSHLSHKHLLFCSPLMPYVEHIATSIARHNEIRVKYMIRHLHFFKLTASFLHSRNQGI